MNPRFHAPVDLETHLAALPARTTCKGVFFRDVIERVSVFDPSVDLFERAGLPSKRHLHFMDYPHAEWMRLTWAAAMVVGEGRVGEGLRELGRHAFEAIFENPLGKVLFGPLGFDLDRVIAHGGTGYRLGLGFGRIRTERLAEGHHRVHFHDFPSFIETFNVGVIEGTVMRYGERPEVRIQMSDLGNAVVDVRWR